MATRRHFANEIANRARKIGWVVNAKDYGYEVRCPDGFKVQIHMTPSDMNHTKTVMRELNNHGFEEAEQNFALLSEAERQARIKQANRKAQEELELAQRNADLLARAAGQQRVSEEVLLTPTPMPKTFERVLITPELASKILQKNSKNRKLRMSEAAGWGKIIRGGLWRYTHQGVAIDSDGVLQDGQHRLTGIVLADIACEMQVSIGMPPENFNAIDTGLKRNFGDVVTTLGIKGGSRVGSIARILIVYDEIPERLWTSKVYNTEVSQYVTQPFDDKRSYGEVMHEAGSLAQFHWKSYRINATSVGAGIFLLWRHVGADNPKVVDFLDGLRTGANLTVNDPRRLLMRYTLNPTRLRSSWLHLALFLKAWNKFAVDDFGLRLLTFRKDEEMPKVYVP